MQAQALPQDLAAAPPAPFWDKIARKYAATPVRDPAAYEATLDRVRARLEPTWSALEVGCGTGSTALRLVPHLASIEATDVSPGMIAIAREKAAAEGAEVTFRAAPAEAPSSAAPFDVVTAFNLLHLVDDPEAAIRALAAQVKPGGLMITKTPCLADGNPLFRVLIPLMRLVGKAPPVRYLSVAGLEATIRAAGFDILETASLPAKPPSRLVIARRL